MNNMSWWAPRAGTSMPLMVSTLPDELMEDFASLVAERVVRLLAERELVAGVEVKDLYEPVRKEG